MAELRQKNLEYDRLQKSVAALDQKFRDEIQSRVSLYYSFHNRGLICAQFAVDLPNLKVPVES